jgi:hypothetical protein
MEDRLSSKDFHKIASIKLSSREETPEWYGILMAHAEMCGVLIPSLDSIMPDSIMGQYWIKKLLGETIHGRCRTMESHVHKLLLTDGLFSKDCDDEYRDIVKASGGNGYDALHNILRLHHPHLTEKKVETRIPAQSISTRFGHHVRAIQDHLYREETRGRAYTKYEALQLVLDTLHPTYHFDLKFRAEKEFGQAHDFDDCIPFKLQMSQLGTTLTTWSTEMRLSDKKAPRILHIYQGTSHDDDDDSQNDPGIFALSEDLKCTLCGRPCHENTSCHKFMNHVIGDALMKLHPKETAWIIRENKQFVTIGPRGTPRTDNGSTSRPPSAVRIVTSTMAAVLDMIPATETASIVPKSPFDDTVQITRLGIDDADSIHSEESEGSLMYGSAARITVCHDVSLDVRYDEDLIDRINATWDEELAAGQGLDLAPSYTSPSTELLYQEYNPVSDVVEFYDALEYTHDQDTQGKDMPTTELS